MDMFFQPAAMKPTMNSKQDNYAKTRDQMRPQFLGYDQEEMIHKFALENDADYLYIRFCGRPYRVGRTTGIVEWSEDNFQTCHEGDFSESMSIYDVLCCSKPDCCLSGEFAPSSSLKGVVLTRMSAGSGLSDPGLAEYFNANMDLLAQACIALGGQPEGKGDLSFQIPVFDFLPVRFAFWQADEEFAPEVRMFWDTNVQSFMHFETIWYVAGHLLKRIEEWMRSKQA